MKSIEEMKSNPRLLVVKEGFDGLMGYLLHPPKSANINIHPYCLHLWKKIGAEYELPPKEFV